MVAGLGEHYDTHEMVVFSFSSTNADGLLRVPSKAEHSLEFRTVSEVIRLYLSLA